MSAHEFYLGKGYTSIAKTVVVSGTNTMAVWSPLGNKRVVVTNVNISTNPAGTIAFYFEANDKIAEFITAGSATIVPTIGSWESTTNAGKIFVKLSASQTDGTRINLTGFELD